MQELSLNILDVTENSTRAKAQNIEISIIADTIDDTLCITIKDDGSGMTKEQVEKVIDPFFTTRTTRRVGLGVPFFKMSAENAGGSFKIDSTVNVGTVVEAKYQLSHLDRMPLGDINATIYTLISCHEDVHFRFAYSVDGRAFVFDTDEIREIIGDISFQTAEVATFIKSFLNENKAEADSGLYI